MHLLKNLTLLSLLVLLMSGCAHPFDRPLDLNNVDKKGLTVHKDGLDAGDIFHKTLSAHLGENNDTDNLSDLNVALSGEWKSLITRIQPLVTDYTYRVASEERLILKDKTYAALYTGPAGTKKVVRTRTATRVFYNGAESFDDNVLQSTAMTADAFFYFLLGPIAFTDANPTDTETGFKRLDDVTEKGRSYYRLYTQMTPGFGDSVQDEVILWVDQETNLTFRMHITLEGYPSTKGAHADVTYLEYQTIDGYTFPIKFHERVRAPIGIDAHSWEISALDINRGYPIESVDNEAWQDAAKTPATQLVTNP